MTKQLHVRPYRFTELFLCNFIFLWLLYQLCYDTACLNVQFLLCSTQDIPWSTKVRTECCFPFFYASGEVIEYCELHFVENSLYRCQQDQCHGTLLQSQPEISRCSFVAVYCINVICLNKRTCCLMNQCSRLNELKVFSGICNPSLNESVSVFVDVQLLVSAPVMSQVHAEYQLKSFSSFHSRRLLKLSKYCQGSQIKEDEISGVYNMQGEMRNSNKICQETCHICVIKRSSHNWRIILKSILGGVLM